MRRYFAELNRYRSSSAETNQLALDPSGYVGLETQAVVSDATLNVASPYGTLVETKHTEQIRRSLHWNYRSVR